MSDFEKRLVRALQPARQYFLAQTIDFGLCSGLFEALAAEPGTALDDVAGRLDMDPDRLAGLLRYLAGEDIVLHPETSPTLTQRGLEILEFRPWYELLPGGYSRTLQELPTVMRDAGAYAGRDGTMVGKGSCGISHHDAIPLIRRLLNHLSTPSTTLVDLGCGDGTFLMDLCESEQRGIGIDPFEPSIRAATKRASALGIADRVRFEVGGAEDFVHEPDGSAPCFIAAFSLQEVLEQQGRNAVVQLVSRLLAAEGAHMAVVEVDRRPLDPEVIGHGLGLTYYNPYYLLHQVTEQRLETTAFWHEVFAEAGAEIVAELTTDPEVDSTGLELGFLLRAAEDE